MSKICLPFRPFWKHFDINTRYALGWYIYFNVYSDTEKGNYLPPPSFIPD